MKSKKRKVRSLNKIRKSNVRKNSKKIKKRNVRKNSKKIKKKIHKGGGDFICYCCEYKYNTEDKAVSYPLPNPNLNICYHCLSLVNKKKIKNISYREKEMLETKENCIFNFLFSGDNQNIISYNQNYEINNTHNELLKSVIEKLFNKFKNNILMNISNKNFLDLQCNKNKNEIQKLVCSLNKN